VLCQVSVRVLVSVTGATQGDINVVIEQHGEIVGMVEFGKGIADEETNNGDDVTFCPVIDDGCDIFNILPAELFSTGVCMATECKSAGTKALPEDNGFARSDCNEVLDRSMLDTAQKDAVFDNDKSKAAIGIVLEIIEPTIEDEEATFETKLLVVIEET